MDTQELLVQIHKLPLESQKQLLETLTRSISPRPEPSETISEDEVERILVAQGFMRMPPDAANYTDADEDFEPVEYTGKPLSEIIIEERR